MIFEKQIIMAFGSQVYVRNDDTGLIRYFTHEDFPGMLAEPFEFRGNKGQKLVGNFYYYDKKRNDRLVIFEHGMGGGHLSYTKEIEKLCKMGYTVFAYDHTGCMKSEGENIGGFAQSLADLDYAIRALGALDEYKNTPLTVVGHSWGAYSTMNIPKIHKSVTHIVAMAGFISVRQILRQFFVGPLRLYVPAVYRLERENAGEYADFDARESLSESGVKALIFHSEDDKTVSFKYHFDKLQRALQKNENVRFIKCSGKGHNPNFTESAASLVSTFFKDLTEKTKIGYFTDNEKKKAFRESYDFDKMSEQDEKFWVDVESFLNH